MATVKCPYGCIVNMTLMLDDDEKIVCPQCHRVSVASSFLDASESTSVSTVESAFGTHSSMSVEFKGLDQANMDRIEKIFDLGSKWGRRKKTRQAKIKQYYNSLIQVMMAAELTTNFPTKSLHYILNSESVLNMWDLAPDLTDKYTKERDDTERDAFGKYSTAIKTSTLQSIRGQDRPGYLVLNVGNFIAGGAPMYGVSYLVYKDAV